MPEPLCGVGSEGCPGGEARVRLRIANCGPAARRIRVQALGDPAGLAVSPPDLNLGPYQRGFVVVSVTIPAAAAKGEEREFVLMVRGCRDHVLRWTVRASTSEACSCDTVEVEDCPDLIHHWYDHFYCARGCAEGR
jgi:hypothetical protein